MGVRAGGQLVRGGQAGGATVDATNRLGPDRLADHATAGCQIATVRVPGQKIVATGLAFAPGISYCFKAGNEPGGSPRGGIG